MKTATRPDDFVTLGQLLQADLQAKLSEAVPVQVRCLPKDGTLVALVQHRAGAELEPEEIFGFLEQTILAQHHSLAPQVNLCLRVAGEKQPYASYSFAIESPWEPTATAPGTQGEGEPDALNPSDSSPVETIDSNEGETESTESIDASATESTLPHPWDDPPPAPDSDRTTAFIPEELAVATPNASTDDLPPETPVSKPTKSKTSLLPLIVTGTGLSLAVFSITLYILTRPCTIGACQAIPEAQQLSEQSLQTLQNPQSGKEVLDAQQQLAQAIRILESIPFWSRYHGEAQEILKAYRPQAENVEQMVIGLKTAVRAAYKSENPPHPASRWIEIQTMWREAIAQLEELPTNSKLQPLAQQKIKEYKQNLAQTNQRLVKERQAKEHIRAAKDAALIAGARQGVAQSLPHWQLVYASWQAAIKRLKQIPQGTTSYDEAQQLLSLYLPKMAVARDRKTQEQISTNNYNQALRLAQLAKNSQDNNQWSVAVIHWRNALTYASQVPRDTYHYTKAQSLVKSYTSVLKQAEVRLQLAIELQQARKDLNQTCYGGKTIICSYTIDPNIIKVKLTPAYIQIVRQRAVIARSRGDANAHLGVVNHILTLGEALEAIGDNARLRVEVYTPEGALIQAHSPGM